ncbi:MAG: hypothetical protein ACRDFB_05200, partial [Rhabdochlamydiaceae bacterium]
NNYFFNNKRVAIHSRGDIPLPSYSDKDNAGEWSLLWVIAWDMVLSIMVCTAAGIFLLNNRETDNVLLKKNKKLLDTVVRQYQDFKKFAGVDVISSQRYKDEFDAAKKHFEIDHYNDLFLKRMELLSAYEIEQENSRHGKWISYLTSVLAFLTAFLVYVELERAH